MSTRNFRDLCFGNWTANRMVCIGLDIVWDEIPDGLKQDGNSKRSQRDVVVDYAKRIVRATADVACAYKIQASKFRLFGHDEFCILRKINDYIFEHASHAAVIYDAKWGDDHAANVDYVTFVYDMLNYDAVTLMPYVGGIANHSEPHNFKPFLDRCDKGNIFVCRSSNVQSSEFQRGLQAVYRDELTLLLEAPFLESRPHFWDFKTDCVLPLGNSHSPMMVANYIIIAWRIAGFWNANANCHLVVGANRYEEAMLIRKIVGNNVFFLAPGTGSQGAAVEKVVKAQQNCFGHGFLLNSSRAICHASTEPDFMQKTHDAATMLNSAINEFRTR